jgi:hypothetical protein
MHNILKNSSPAAVLWMSTFNFFTWIFISLKLLFEGRYGYAASIYKGLWWNFRNYSILYQKRRSLYKHNNTYPVIKIIIGELSLGGLFSKGWRWLNSV